MNADQLAALHGLCFTSPRPWSAAEFNDMRKQGACVDCEQTHGFIVTQTVADEAEILTLAVDPNHRRRGIAQRLVADFLARTSISGTKRVFLEVAKHNLAARRLYDGCGFRNIGRRPGYYRLADGRQVDALLFEMRIDQV